MTNSDKNQSSGFIFGMVLGAAVGAISAILVQKNGQPEIIENFEDKIKRFFQDLIEDNRSPKHPPAPKKEIIGIDEEIVSPVIIKKKVAPKMFVKPKR